MEKAFVYILKSERSGKYYVGSTKDPVKRLVEHNSGRTPSTQSGRPWEMCLTHEYQSIADAKKVEYRIKRMKSRKFIENMLKNGEIKFTLGV